MPKIVKMFTRKPTESLYPWDQWFSQLASLKQKQAIRLSQGVDFECSVKSMREQLYRKAKLRGVEIRTRIDDKHVDVALEAEK